MVLTRRLALVAALLGVGLLAYPGSVVGNLWWTLALINGVLLIVAMLDSLLAPSVGVLVISREHPPVVVLGEAAVLGWSVHNASGRRVHLRLADELAPSLRATTRRVTLRLKPGATATASTTIEPARRGRFPMSEVTLRINGPLGLGARQRRVSVPTMLRVHPPFRSRDEAELRIRRARMLDIGLRSSIGVGGGTEFEQLREYTADDEYRRVDWAASARTGRTIVRTYRPEQNQTMVVMLDAGRVMAGRVDDVPRLEHAMDAVMMLGAVASGLGDKVGLMTFATEVDKVVAPARNRDQVSRMTEAMFDLEPALAESDYSGAFSSLLSRFRRRALIVILSDLQPQMVEDSLIPALPLILRHHLVVVGAVMDPAVVRWADGAAADGAETYRKAAAIAALAERRRIALRLSGLGVTVIDAVPGQLSTRLADAYLSVKAAGRL